MIYRVDVCTLPAARDGQPAFDPVGEAVRHQIQEFGTQVGPILSTRVFLIDAETDAATIRRVALELLADPIVESAALVEGVANDTGKSRIEIHLKAGVMDPVAASTEMALQDMGVKVNEVRTGRAYLIDGIVSREELQHIASRVLANGVIESVHFDRYVPAQFAKGKQEAFKLRHVELNKLDDAQLTKLSREGHLFLSLSEMKAIQDYFRCQKREPTDVELETIAQTWSEHCVHKTLKSAVEVEERDATGKVTGSRQYKNLIKDTIFRSTMELMKEREGFTLSVFADNAGVVAFDETDAVCFKVETHNHPSAIEPYGGSATGIGGVIRDILGTGLGAKPVANTDVFCVAHPDTQKLPKGVIHPKRTLQQVVAGVRDYGNRMGIPTVNGAVYFDDRYLGNPLVFCGCVGLIPRDKIAKASQAGDAIVVMGGRTGRDGIHGATFSSAELTDTHADEFSHAVQIGNAITEKKAADVLLQARDRNLFSAVTDCGAGGLSSAVGEMAAELGAAVELDKVPLKYAGLRYDEIWISEAQERMVLSVPSDKVEALLKLSRDEDVESTVIGTFGTPTRDLILNYDAQEVGRISMSFLHDGIPMPTRRAVVTRDTGVPAVRTAQPIKESLLKYLSHPNIASKHWIIRQYDHEVQGGSVIKPLMGPLQIGPSDAAVIRPKLGSDRGVVIACGLAPSVQDPYAMAIASIDEAIRNAVAVGADPLRLAILDNFCWPSVDDEITMGTLVRACEACYDAAKAYKIPFISGKDSLHNQFTIKETGEVIRIPNTLLISAIGVIEDVHKCVTMDFKHPSNPVVLVRTKNTTSLEDLAKTHRAIAATIGEGHVAGCHDISDGGWLTAAAEMCIASGLGLSIGRGALSAANPFEEFPGGYLLEVRGNLGGAHLKSKLGDVAQIVIIGDVHADPVLVIEDESPPARLPVDELTRAWRGTLDW